MLQISHVIRYYPYIESKVYSTLSLLNEIKFSSFTQIVLVFFFDYMMANTKVSRSTSRIKVTFGFLHIRGSKYN